MTLDEGIIHAKDVARNNHEAAIYLVDEHPTQAEKCEECAREHEQLAEWLKELKAYKEQSGDVISRQAVLDILKDKWNMFSDANDAMQESIDTIKVIPSVTPQPQPKTEKETGRWIPTGYDGYADGNPVYDWWECSKCGWEHCGDEESLTAFCPNCGQPKMEVKEWWVSADTSEERYRQTVSWFKKKWFEGDRQERLKGYIDSQIGLVRKELYQLIGEDSV